MFSVVWKLMSHSSLVVSFTPVTMQVALVKLSGSQSENKTTRHKGGMGTWWEQVDCVGGRVMREGGR